MIIQWSSISINDFHIVKEWRWGQETTKNHSTMCPHFCKISFPDISFMLSLSTSPNLQSVCSFIVLECNLIKCNLMIVWKWFHAENYLFPIDILLKFLNHEIDLCFQRMGWREFLQLQKERGPKLQSLSSTSSKSSIEKNQEDDHKIRKLRIW